MKKLVLLVTSALVVLATALAPLSRCCWEHDPLPLEELHDREQEVPSRGGQYGTHDRISGILCARGTPTSRGCPWGGGFTPETGCGRGALDHGVEKLSVLNAECAHPAPAR
jgi:hypothetical protein